MRTKLSLITLFACASAASLFADGENFDGRDLSGMYFGYESLIGSSWVEANLTGADLHYARLTNANFTGATLRDADLSGVLGRNANFTDADLTGARFYDYDLSDLTGANFTNANLTSVYLRYATLTNADFTDAVIVGANFSESNLTLSQLYSTASYKEKNLSGVGLIFFDLSNEDFSGVNLTSADLSDATLTNADFTGANFRSADLRYTMLTNADFTDAVIVGADFYYSNLTLSQLYSTASYKEKNLSGVGLLSFDLSNTDFSGFNLTSADLRYATLTNADFTGANSTSANLSGATLTNADFTDAVIVGADFCHSKLTLSQLYSTASYKEKNLSGVGLSFFDLSNADFSGVNLTSADLWYATLTGADFTGANLTSADLSDATLTNANFRNANLTNANLGCAILTNADFRGATGLSLTWDSETKAFSDATITGTSVILADGTIGNFAVASGEKLRIRAHEISAKLNDAGAIAAGGEMEIAGSVFELGGTLVNNGKITVVAQANGANSQIVIKDGATLTNSGTILVHAGTLGSGESVAIFSDESGNAVAFNQGTIKAFGGIYSDGIFTAGGKNEAVAGGSLNVDLAAGATITVTDHGHASEAGVKHAVTLSATASIVINAVTNLDIAEIVLGETSYEIGASWDFDITKADGVEVLVTMQIGTGLSVDGLKIFHREGGENANWTNCTNQVGHVSYDSATGEISFVAKDFSSYAVSGKYDSVAIPEPSTFGLLAGLGALFLVGTRRRRKIA